MSDSSGRRLPTWRAGDLLALAPAAGLGLLSLAFGTFPGTVRLLGLDLPGGASAVGAIGLHLLLLAAVLFAAPGWRQPLGLGRRGRLLHLALWVTVAAAAWASPVPRAGRVAVLTLPAWLLVPAAVARCWPGERQRRRGIVAVAAVVATVSLVALADRFAGGSPRAAMPLGHHNLLAVWLVALLPAAALPLRAAGPGRWIAAAAVAAGGGALASSGSLAGALGILAVLVVAGLGAALRRAGADGGGEGDEPEAGGPTGLGGLGAERNDGELEERHPRRRRASDAVSTGAGPAPGTVRRRRLVVLLAGAAAIAVAIVAALRLARVVAGADPSFAVRAEYYRAGWRGFLARPLLGWGPGATPWTLAEWLQPVPGVHPPGEIVGDLHSLPLQLLYELGPTGLLLALAVGLLFAWRRLVALPVAEDAGLVVAGLLGLAGAGVALAAVAPLAVPAVPAALALAAGAALAGENEARLPLRRPRSRADLPVFAYVVAAGLLLLPIDAAHLAADRSLDAVSPRGERAALGEAAQRDPEMPLYRARLARLADEAGPGAGGAAAAEALTAAETAWGVGALWLLAGDVALAAGEAWAPIALERACRLDPLAAQAPYLLALAEPRSPAAPRRAARALAAEPRLAAALAWRRHPGLRQAALAELARREEIEPGWRLAMAAAAAAAWSEMTAAGGPPNVAHLALVADRHAATSLSLHAFRRRPRPLVLTRVAVDAAAVRQLALPPAAVLPTTSRSLFGDESCRDGASDER